MRATLSIALAALLLAACGGSGPANTAMAFNKAVAAGKTSTAMDMMTLGSQFESGEMRDKVEDGLAEAGKEMRDAGGIKKMEVVEEDVGESRATVTLRTTLKNGDVNEDDYAFRKVDGKWKLNPLD